MLRERLPILLKLLRLLRLVVCRLLHRRWLCELAVAEERVAAVWW